LHRREGRPGLLERIRRVDHRRERVVGDEPDEAFEVGLGVHRRADDALVSEEQTGHLGLGDAAARPPADDHRPAASEE